MDIQELLRVITVITLEGAGPKYIYPTMVGQGKRTSRGTTVTQIQDFLEKTKEFLDFDNKITV